MKHKSLFVLFSLITAFILSSCEVVIDNSLTISESESTSIIAPTSSGDNDDSIPDSSFVSIDSTGTTSDISSSNSTDTSVGTSTDTQQNYYQPTSYNTHLRDVNGDEGMLGMPHVGNQKLLVVPVQLSSGTTYTTTMTDRLDKAFFGASSDTSWESVASYYQKSSYGKLNITGEVTDVLVSSYSVSQLNSYGDNAPEYIANEFYSQASSSLLKNYDTDNDGWVDSVCFIYSNAYSTSSSSAYWAWVYWLGNTPSSSKPTINTHMWASYTFMAEGYGSSGIDSHTYIHETGHLLGLDDYYPYDNNYNAAGQLDMMDNNILDHNVYSKMAMEWTYPYVVTGSTTITLRPFESSGDCIIINDNWNGSALDEYIAIEFYTPTGLNKKDSDATYANGLRGFTINGVKIYHIDSRVVKLNGSRFGSYVDSISNFNNGDYAIGAANSDQWSETDGGNYKLVHLMEATGSNSFKNSGTASNSTLFTAGKSFTPSSVFFEKGTKFNDGSTVGYTINVVSVSSTQAVIEIIKN